MMFHAINVSGQFESIASITVEKAVLKNDCSMHEQNVLLPKYL